MATALKKWPINTHYLWTSSRKQIWDVSVKTSGSGLRRSMTNQTYSRWAITFSLFNLSDDEERTLHGFVAMHKGNYKPFLWLDPDASVATDIALVAVDSTNAKYQCMILYDSYSIPAPYVEDVTVKGDGAVIAASGYTVDNNTGIITFTTAPTAAKLTATFKYWWKVVLNSTEFTTARQFKNFVNVDSLEMETVL
nr:MAG TPA: minor tail protein [Bacteriophage sp.]